jgi:alkanesulfonate monooxygenase SsuD/methylene tetrahydromethanopterin reductase-like flavin-dependent oxidoreductase (luciferase family)
VRFGIFFEIGVPAPFVGNIEHQVFHNALEQARLADDLGFHCIWAVEHHFLEEYSHSSAPELLLTAIAAQTERIRVGHGAVVCVPEINHPIRVAERAAVLDILSNGRLEFGTARSSTWTEVGGFGVDPDTTKKTWDEYVRVLPKMWTEEYLSWDGVCFSMPERSILPKPVQDPHPPLWVTVTSPGTELDAAERGIGCLGVASAGYAEQERRTKEYHRRIQNCNPVSSVVNDNVSTLNFLYCHPDPKVAQLRGLGMQGRFGVENTNLLFTREAFPSNAYQSLGNLAPKPPKQEAGSAADMPAVPEGTCIGDPEHIIDAVKHWESIGIDEINLMLNGLEVLEQKEVLDSKRLFASEVMPHFSDTTGGR